MPIDFLESFFHGKKTPGSIFLFGAISLCPKIFLFEILNFFFKMFVNLTIDKIWLSEYFDFVFSPGYTISIPIDLLLISLDLFQID